MRSLGHRLTSAYAAAFLAVALLTYAVVPSTIMQAGPPADASMPMCSMGDMGSTAHEAGKTSHAPAKAQEVCSFCAAAHHAPVLAIAPPLRAPSVVAWLRPLPPSLLGPRGPPATSPKARGPPASLLTV